MTKEEAKFGTDRQCKVSAKAYAAVMLAVSTEKTRYYLNGVLIEPCPIGGVNLVATNGHLIIAVHDKDGETNGKWICPVPSQMRQFLLANLEPRPDPEEMDGDFYANEPGIATTPEKRKPDRINFDGHMASITAPEHAWQEKSPVEVVMAAKAQAIDGTFPNWAAVVPRPTEGGPSAPAFTVAARYTTKLSRAASIWTERLGAGVRVRGIDKHGPVLAGAFENEDILMVLMPIRDDAPPMDIPAWMPAPVQPTA